MTTLGAGNVATARLCRIWRHAWWTASWLLLPLQDGHPWFEVVRLGASGRSEGKSYEKATTWNVTGA